MKKKYEGTGLISEKTKVLYAELNERAEAATDSYSVTGDSLSYLFVHEFSVTDIFNDINHVYRAAILKKNSL